MEKKTLKQLIIASSISVLALTSSILSFVNLSDAKGTSLKSKEWMKEIAGSKYLSQLSIPGTHDSGALYSIGDLAGKCQDLSIAKQLDAGARLLDIRLDVSGGQLKVIHGIVDERDTFDNVVDACKSFLKKHNSETIIMSVKEENVGKSNNFHELVEEKIDKNKELWYIENNIPTLEEVRGKIVLFSRYQNNTYGVDMFDGWQENTSFDIVHGLNVYHVQDHYKLNNVEEKMNSIKDCLNYRELNPNVFTLNFMSGYLDSGFPPSYSVPVAKKINKQVKETFKEYSNTGAVLFDFISEDLAKAIYERNI